MPRYLFSGLMIAALLLFSAAAQAQSDGDSNQHESTESGNSEAYGAAPNAYLGVSGFVGFDDSSGTIGRQTHDGGGVTTHLGFRVFDPFAIELQGDYFSGYSDFDGWVLTVNARIYLLEFWRETPGRFQVYFIGGGGVMGGYPAERISYQLEGAFRFGGGATFYLTDDLALDLGTDWVVGRSSFKDANYLKVALGLQYNF